MIRQVMILSVILLGEVGCTKSAVKPQSKVALTASPSNQASSLHTDNAESLGMRRSWSFGWAVALSLDTLVIADPDSNESGFEEFGTAYVFVRTGITWSQQAILAASERKKGDRFGRSLAISGDTIVIGAPSTDIGEKKDAGAAYVFARKGTVWSQQAQILPTSVRGSDYFASSVALSYSLAVPRRDCSI